MANLLWKTKKFSKTLVASPLGTERESEDTNKTGR